MINLHIPGWEPLNSERGPHQALRVESIVKEGGILLPGVVLVSSTILGGLIFFSDSGRRECGSLTHF
jgi:hypothetical protein